MSGHGTCELKGAKSVSEDGAPAILMLTYEPLKLIHRIMCDVDEITLKKMIKANITDGLFQAPVIVKYHVQSAHWVKRFLFHNPNMKRKVETYFSYSIHI